MFSLNELLTIEHESEHVYEHNLQLKKQYSDPKIYIANGDLTKRWYVYFSYQNPETGKLERSNNIYGKVNKFKTKEQCISLLNTYRKRLSLFLKDGYNPFEENTEFYQAKMNPSKPVDTTPIESKPTIKPIINTKIVETKVEETEPKLTLKEAFDFGLNLKESIVQPFFSKLI